MDFHGRFFVWILEALRSKLNGLSYVQPFSEATEFETKSMGFTLEISMGGRIEGWEPVPRWLWCFCGQFV